MAAFSENRWIFGDMDMYQAFVRVEDELDGMLERHSEKMCEQVFYIEGDGKSLKPLECKAVEDCVIELEFAEGLPRFCTVSSAADIHIAYEMPIDTNTRYSMASFHALKVLRTDKISGRKK